MVDRIVWQPFGLWGEKQDFSALMDEDFAREMIRLKLPEGRQESMNELANKELQRMQVNWRHPYQFHEDTAFVEQIYLGQNGVWLAIESYTIRTDLLKKVGTGKPIRYLSHNVDILKQRNDLLNLMDLWVHYSDVIGKP